MSVHPSFKSGKVSNRRAFEAACQAYTSSERRKWEEDKNSIFGLPKVKVVKLKFKKEKKEAAEGADAAATSAAPGAEDKAKEAPKDKGKK